MAQEFIEFVEVFHQDLSGLGSFLGADYAGALQLVHDAACLCISHAKTALKV